MENMLLTRKQKSSLVTNYRWQTYLSFKNLGRLKEVIASIGGATSNDEKAKDIVIQPHCGMCRTFCFYDILRRQFERVFGLLNEIQLPSEQI